MIAAFGRITLPGSESFAKIWPTVYVCGSPRAPWIVTDWPVCQCRSSASDWSIAIWLSVSGAAVDPNASASTLRSLAAVTYSGLPSMRTWSFHIPDAARTPGSPAVLSITAGSKVGGRDPVWSPLIMIWALTVSATCALRLLLAESMITVTPVTRAMPTISAAAVIAVRRGLRPELSRPSRPGSDQEKSRPSMLITGLLISGVSRATPMNATSTPPRISHSVALPLSEANRPVPSIAAPADRTAPPNTLILVSGRSGMLTSCIAATGAIREARSAGSTAATTVTTRPTTNALITAESGTPIEASVRSANEPNRAARPAPAPTPAARPSTAAIRPIITASTSTEPIT